MNMLLKDIYNLAVEMGIKADLRGEARVRQLLRKEQEKYDKLDEKAKSEFDLERLANPYSDSRILFDNGRHCQRILVGIDIDPQEIIIAKQLGYDTVIAHHPIGGALAELGDVLHLQTEVLAKYGVPINIADALTKERVSEVARRFSPENHYRAVDAARLLDINLVCIHTPCDNLAAKFLEERIEAQELETVGELIEILKQIPEYKIAIGQKAGPKIFAGNEGSYAGKIALTEITGGTSNSKELIEKCANAGIGTIVGMHMGEDHRKEADKWHVNVVIAGHISSDSLGLNILLDELAIRGLEVEPISGVIRINRKS